MNTKELWKPENIDLNNADVDDLKFIFSQAEKNLSQTFEVANAIATKTYALLGFISTVVIGITGYVVSEISKGSIGNIDSSLMCILFYFFIVIVYLRPNIFPRDYYIIGTSPEKLLKAHFFQITNEKHINTKRLYINEIINYKLRIEENEDVNMKRWDIFTRASLLFIATPILFLIIYFFFRLFV